LKNRFELIQALEHEIVRHDTTFAVSVPDVMQALFDVVTSVRRWSDLEQLRAERANLERETTAEFIEHEQRLTDFAKGPIGALGSAKQHRETGLCEPHDELARRIGTELAGRKEASALLDLVGRRSDRAKVCSAALETAGLDSVVKAIAPTRAVSDPRPGLGLAIQSLQFQMGGTDPETDQYKRLAAEIATLEARVNAAGPVVENLQRQAAVALLDRVKAGELAAIREVESIIGRIPAMATVAEQLSESRGTRLQLIMTLEQVLKPVTPTPCTQCGK
jgi:hypothetical protein